MTGADRIRFGEALGVLAETFHEQVSELRAEGYFEALGDLSIEAVERASREALRSARFFPKPIELRELVEGSIDDRGERAWMQLHTLAHVAGGYCSVLVLDAALAQAITSTFRSWPDFCALELDPPMWAAKRKEFLGAYRASARQSAGTANLYLVGRVECENRAHAAQFDESIGLFPQDIAIAGLRGEVRVLTVQVDPKIAGPTHEQIAALVTSDERKHLERRNVRFLPASV